MADNNSVNAAAIAFISQEPVDNCSIITIHDLGCCRIPVSCYYDYDNEEENKC